MARYGTWRRAALAVAAILSAGSGLFVGGTAVLPVQAAAVSGSPAAWGNDGWGQLGDSTAPRIKGATSLANRPLAGPVVTLTNVAAMATGANHSLALLPDGTVWAWGYDFAGQLGITPPSPNTNRLPPALVPGLTGVAAVAAGSSFSLALKSGTVLAWGSNDKGQLGDNTLVNHTAPAAIAGLTGVTAISAGYSHSLALKGDGSVWAWGFNGYGQLGNNTSADSKVPVQVVGLGGVGTLNATAISAGVFHNLALSNGAVVAWGEDNNGQLGDNQNIVIVNPAPVPVFGLSSPSGVTALAAGNGQSLALKSDNTVLAWGDNASGQLGDNTTTRRFAPGPVVGLSGVSAISAAQDTSLALKSDSSAWAWGYNGYGAVGDNTFTSRTAPVPVLGISGVIALGIGASGLHSLAVVGAFPPVISAGYDTTRSPSTWTPGQTQTYAVTVTNSSNQTWLSGGSAPVHLGVRFATSGGGFSANSSTWLTDQRFSLPADLAPNSSVTITVSVTAPNTAANLVLEYQMVKEGAFWFTQFADTNVTVGPPIGSAGYVVNNPPASWAPGQTQTYTVTLTNTDSQLWPAGGATPVDLGVHFATIGGGYSVNISTWLTDQRFSLPADLAPGSSVTIPVSVTAPNTTGNLVLEYQMVKEGAYWFTQFADANVTVGTPVWSASYAVSNPPISWTPGQTQTYTVTVTNTGNQTWPSGGSSAVRLGVHFATSGGGFATNSSSWLTDQRFSLPADLAPNASATISASVTAPNTTANLVLEYQMVKETQFWFPQFDDTNVTVGTPVWSASYVVSNPPPSWTQGQTQTYTVTVTNTGTQTWPAGGSAPVHLGVHFATNGGGFATNSSSWLTDQRFSLPADLAPKASVTLPVSVTAPTSPGSLILEYQMVKEGAFWLTQFADTNVSVV